MLTELEELNIFFPVHFKGVWSTITLFDVVDIFIVALILYKIYVMLQDTRAITLVKGLLVLFAVTMACRYLEFHAVSWLLVKALTLLFVALPIVFQPELRRGLERIGQGSFFGRSVILDNEAAKSVVNELVKAIEILSKTKTGALLVIERDMGLDDISLTGIRIEGLITADFLLNVFIVNTPLHDGAAVIRGNRLISAGCLLPLTENLSLSKELGTRHRAALGLSEQCDALIVVVSEETGIVSVTENGHMLRHLDSEGLREILQPVFQKPSITFKDWIMNWRRKK